MELLPEERQPGPRRRAGGHSQGSFILIDLIKSEIDGKPIQSRLVSAILMGTVVPVPKGKDVGGAFQHIPLCHSRITDSDV